MNDAGAALPGTFAVAGDRWMFAGTLTFDDATAVLSAAARLAPPSSGIVDMSGLVHADSAALAVLLALKRRAAAEGRRLSFAAMPAALESLARVYGIEELVAA
jgi:phospholipid transport system transporter-binding protein